MNEIILSNPDAKVYADLIHALLWTACFPTYTVVMISWAAMKILKAVFKDV